MLAFKKPLMLALLRIWTGIAIFGSTATSVAVAQSALSSAAQRVRPFITDDARVVGNRLAQLESWYRQDKETIQQWFLRLTVQPSGLN
jgi:hypothetical protein